MTAIVRRNSPDDMARLERAIRVQATIHVVGSLVELYTNGDADMEDKAVEAADRNLPVYWTTARTDEIDARNVCRVLNGGVIMSDALRVCGIVSDGLRNAVLNSLIPLNPKAATEIRLARGA